MLYSFQCFFFVHWMWKFETCLLDMLDFYDWIVMIVGKKGTEGIEGSGETSSSCTR